MTKTSKKGAGELILLVDDTANDREATRMRLEQLGYQVIEAADASGMKKCLARKDGAVKAVFLDQKLGDDERAGLELLPWIRETYPELPVVVYTATVEDLGEEFRLTLTQ